MAGHVSTLSDGRPWKRLLILVEWGAAATVAILALGVFLYRLPVLLRGGELGDFGVYYFAAEALDRGYALYTAPWGYHPPVPGGADWFANNGYIYPPLLAGLFRPLTAIPFAVAKALWLPFNLLLLVGSAYLIARIVRWPRVALPLAVATILLPSTYYALIFGQISPLLLFLLVAMTALCSLHGQPRWAAALAGICLGLCVMIKLFPALYVLAFLAGRRWLAAIATGAATIAWALIGLAVGGGWQNTRTFFLDVASGAAVDVTYPASQSVQSVILRLFSARRYGGFGPQEDVTIVFRPLVEAPALGGILGYGLAVLIVGASCYALFAYSKKHAGAIPLLPPVALLVATSLLVTPSVRQDYYPLLAIPFAVLADQYRRDEGRVEARRAAIFALLFLVAHASWRLLTPLVPSPLFLSVGFLGVLILWAALLRGMLRPQRHQSGPTSSREHGHAARRASSEITGVSPG